MPGARHLISYTLQKVSVYLAVSMFFGSLAGCGYTLVGAAPGGQGQRLSVAVVPFTNQTREPDVERHTTAALRHALLHNQTFVLTSEASAGRRILGTIRRFRTRPLSFDTNDNVLEYRLEADIQVRLVETTAQRPLFEQEISAWAEYLVSATGDVREAVVAREAALVRLAEQFASKYVALLTMTLL
jgi:hypothetical protein